MAAINPNRSWERKRNFQLAIVPVHVPPGAIETKQVHSLFTGDRLVLGELVPKAKADFAINSDLGIAHMPLFKNSESNDEPTISGNDSNISTCMGCGAK